MTALSLADLCLLLLGAVVAGFVQGLSGFAFSMVSMAIWVWTLDPKLAAVMAVFGSLVGQVIGVFTVSRNLAWRELAPFVLGGLVGIPLGVMLLPRLDADVFKFGLGALLVIACPMAAYIASGAVTRPMWPLLPLVAAAVLLPSMIGARFYHRLSEQSFRRIVLGLLTAAGAVMLISAAPRVLRWL